jgi:hypothetical protein
VNERAAEGDSAARSSLGLAELPDELGEPRRLVQRDEGVAVRYLDQPSVREEFGEASAVFGRHDAVALLTARSSVTRSRSSRRLASPRGDPADRR